MSADSKRASTAHGAGFVWIIVLLAALYLIAYRARIESGDALMLFDTVSSWVDHGDFRLDLAAWHRPPTLVGDFDLVAYNIEPLPVILASPLYALAKLAPDVGMVHVVYLFNIIVGALSGGVLYTYGLTLGYSTRTAVSAALLFGVGTILFPYTQSFFREPLLLLLLLFAAWCVEHARLSKNRPLFWWMLACASGIGAFLTKSSASLALPAFLIIAAPSFRLDRRSLRWIGLVVLGLALITGSFIALSAFGLVEGRYNLIGRLDAASGGYLGLASSAYLLSPGGSIWGTSPILLLALPGAWIAVRAGKWRYPLAAFILTLSFAFGYAILSGQHWFGGLSAPPRFLIPVVPFLMIAAFPALDRIVHRRHALVWGVFAALCAYSLWWQFSTASYWWGVYPQQLPAESGGLVEWARGLYELRYLRPVVLSALWGELPLDLAWVTIQQPGWALAFAALVGVCVLGLIRRMARFVWIAPLVLIILTAGYMRALYAVDDRYDASNTPLIAMLDIIDVETTADDVIVLASPRYQPFFSNAYRGAARVMALQEQPGEQPSDTQPPFVRSDNPDMLLTPITIPMIHRLASEHERLWLLVEFSPELAWSVRPVERFMVSHYHPIRQFQTSPTVRLIEFSTADAPDPFGFRGADRNTDLVYGEALRLLGVTLPYGVSYTAGSALPVSLHWMWSAGVPAARPYTVALYLRDANGAPVTQNDWQPGFGFAPTETWTPNLPVWDNRALRLPSDLPAGDYQLWVKIYEFIDGAPHDLSVAGSATLDGVIGVLPVTIQVE